MEIKDEKCCLGLVAVCKKISPINTASNLSFAKAARCEINLRLGAGWVILSRWLEGNQSQSSQASVAGKTISLPCHLTACGTCRPYSFSVTFSSSDQWPSFWELRKLSKARGWWISGHPLQRFRVHRKWLWMLVKNASDSSYKILSALLSLRHPSESSPFLTSLF